MEDGASTEDFFLVKSQVSPFCCTRERVVYMFILCARQLELTLNQFLHLIICFLLIDRKLLFLRKFGKESWLWILNVQTAPILQESLIAASKLREEVDLEKGRAKWDNTGLEKELEICIRAKNNAWVIARVTRGRELYMVLEKANETLLYASDAVEKFSNK